MSSSPGPVIDDVDRPQPHRFARLDAQPHDPVRVVARRAAPHGWRVVAERPQGVGRLVDGAVREPAHLRVGEIVALRVSARASDTPRMLSAIGRSTPSISMRIRSAADAAAAPGQREQRDEDAAHAGHAGGRAAMRHSGDASQVAARDVTTGRSRATLWRAHSRVGREFEARDSALDAAGIESPLVDHRPPVAARQHDSRAAGAVSFVNDERCRHRAFKVLGQAGVRRSASAAGVRSASNAKSSSAAGGPPDRAAP